MNAHVVEGVSDLETVRRVDNGGGLTPVKWPPS